MSLKYTNNSLPLSTNNTHPLEQMGLSAILIFNDSGMPIYTRDYTNATSDDTGETVVISAFISSLSNFVKIYDNDLLQGFSTESNRFYVKTLDDMIYCLVLNNNIFNLGSGDLLTGILDTTVEQLVKSFNVYYKMTRTKDFIEKNFLTNFQKQIDILISFNFKNKEAKPKKAGQFNALEDEFLSDSFNYSFLKHGILGLFILDADNKPLLVRDYGIHGKYNTKIDYYQRIVLTLKQYGQSNLAQLTDIGVGPNRITLKIVRDITVCIVLAEHKYWLYDYKSLNLLLIGLLHNLDFSLLKHSKFEYDFTNNSIQSTKDRSITYKIDHLLYSNLMKIKNKF